MSQLTFSDPIKHAWIRRLIANMTAIREGKHQQILERASREQLQQEEELIPNKAIDGFDYDENEDDFGSLASNETMDAIIHNLPELGSHTSHLGSDAKTVTALLNNDSQLHVSRRTNTSSQRPYTKQPVANKQRLAKMDSEFKAMLTKKKEEMYSDNHTINYTGSNHAFKSAETICQEENLDPDQKNCFQC